jgi:hypothetical protein
MLTTLLAMFGISASWILGKENFVEMLGSCSNPCGSMFLTRTVAAEICMEAPTNEHAYKALKYLDKTGDLRFELSSLIEDLLKVCLRLFS